MTSSQDLVPELRSLKQRLNDLNLKAARFGISTPPEYAIEKSDLEQAVSLAERIGIHRGNLVHLRRQAATFGAHVPGHIMNEIKSNENQIATLRGQIRRYNVTIAANDLDTTPDFIPEAPPQQQRVTPPLNWQDEVRAQIRSLEATVQALKRLIGE